MTPDQDQRRKEQSRRIENVMGFIKQAETKYPNLSSSLPGLLLGLLGSNKLDPEELIRKQGLIGDGIAVMGNWLATNGFVGFRVEMGFGGELRLGAARAAIEFANKGPLPDRSNFFKGCGVPPEHLGEVQNALVDLSSSVGEALAIGYTPKQVLSALFIESTARVGDERPNTSLVTREVLNNASGGQLLRLNQIMNAWMQGR
jgi:hypothetical protein